MQKESKSVTDMNLTESRKLMKVKFYKSNEGSDGKYKTDASKILETHIMTCGRSLCCDQPGRISCSTFLFCFLVL